MARTKSGRAGSAAGGRVFGAEPRLLLADEPTGNLDRRTGSAVLETMFDLAHRTGAATSAGAP